MRSTTSKKIIFSEIKASITFAIPLIIGQILQMSMGMVDTIMAGNLSANDLAAVGMGGGLFHPVLFLLGGVLFAVSPITAHLFGAKEYSKIGSSLRQVLWTALLLSIIGFCITRNLVHLCQFLKVDESLIPLIGGYLNAVSYGIPGMFLFFASKSFFEGISKVRAIMLWSIVGLICNIIGNYAFVYGHFGFPRMGAVGTGVATALVMWTMFIGMLISAYFSKTLQKFEIFNHFDLPNFSKISEIIKIGTPIGIGLSMEIGIFAMVALMAGRFGASKIAGHQIALNISGMTYMVPLGLSLATTARIGQAYGAGDLKRVDLIGKVNLALSMLFMICSALSIFTFRYNIASLYTLDTEVLAVAANLLIFASFYQIFDGMQVSGLGCLRGLKDTKIPMYINILSYWGIGIPVSYYFGVVRNGNVQGLWYGLISGLLLAGIFQNLRYFKTVGKKLRASY